jgi:hypothetical protein
MKREAVEDFRLDYEDGFGIRPDEEEDAVAVQGAKAVAAGMKQGLCRRSSASDQTLQFRVCRTRCPDFEYFYQHFIGGNWRGASG